MKNQQVLIKSFDVNEFNKIVNKLVIETKKYIKRKNIIPYNIYIGYSRQSLTIESYIDELENNIKSLEKRNIFNAQQFKAGLVDGAFVGSELWRPTFGRCVDPGDFNHVCICEKEYQFIDRLEYEMNYDCGKKFELPYKQLVKQVYSLNDQWSEYGQELVLITNSLENDTGYIWYPNKYVPCK